MLYCGEGGGGIGVGEYVAYSKRNKGKNDELRRGLIGWIGIGLNSIGLDSSSHVFAIGRCSGAMRLTIGVSRRLRFVLCAAAAMRTRVIIGAPSGAVPRTRATARSGRSRLREPLEARTRAALRAARRERRPERATGSRRVNTERVAGPSATEIATCTAATAATAVAALLVKAIVARRTRIERRRGSTKAAHVGVTASAATLPVAAAIPIARRRCRRKRLHFTNTIGRGRGLLGSCPWATSTRTTVWRPTIIIFKSRAFWIYRWTSLQQFNQIKDKKLTKFAQFFLVQNIRSILPV